MSDIDMDVESSKDDKIAEDFQKDEPGRNIWHMPEPEDDPEEKAVESILKADRSEQKDGGSSFFGSSDKGDDDDDLEKPSFLRRLSVSHDDQTRYHR